MSTVFESDQPMDCDPPNLIDKDDELANNESIITKNNVYEEITPGSEFGDLSEFLSKISIFHFNAL